MAARMPYCTKNGREEDERPRHGHLLVVVVPEVRGEQRKERDREEHAGERQAGPQRQRAGDVLEVRPRGRAAPRAASLNAATSGRRPPAACQTAARLLTRVCQR